MDRLLLDLVGDFSGESSRHDADSPRPPSHSTPTHDDHDTTGITTHRYGTEALAYSPVREESSQHSSINNTDNNREEEEEAAEEKREGSCQIHEGHRDCCGKDDEDHKISEKAVDNDDALSVAAIEQQEFHGTALAEGDGDYNVRDTTDTCLNDNNNIEEEEAAVLMVEGTRSHRSGNSEGEEGEEGDNRERCFKDLISSVRMTFEAECEKLAHFDILKCSAYTHRIEKQLRGLLSPRVGKKEEEERNVVKGRHGSNPNSDPLLNNRSSADDNTREDGAHHNTHAHDFTTVATTATTEDEGLPLSNHSFTAAREEREGTERALPHPKIKVHFGWSERYEFTQRWRALCCVPAAGSNEKTCDATISLRKGEKGIGAMMTRRKVGQRQQPHYQRQYSRVVGGAHVGGAAAGSKRPREEREEEEGVADVSEFLTYVDRERETMQRVGDGAEAEGEGEEDEDDHQLWRLLFKRRNLVDKPPALRKGSGKGTDKTIGNGHHHPYDDDDACGDDCQYPFLSRVRALKPRFTIGARKCRKAESISATNGTELSPQVTSGANTNTFCNNKNETHQEDALTPQSNDNNEEGAHHFSRLHLPSRAVLLKQFYVGGKGCSRSSSSNGSTTTRPRGTSAVTAVEHDNDEEEGDALLHPRQLPTPPARIVMWGISHQEEEEEEERHRCCIGTAKANEWKRKCCDLWAVDGVGKVKRRDGGSSYECANTLASRQTLYAHVLQRGHGQQQRGDTSAEQGKERNVSNPNATVAVDDDDDRTGEGSLVAAQTQWALSQRLPEALLKITIDSQASQESSLMINAGGMGWGSSTVAAIKSKTAGGMLFFGGNTEKSGGVGGGSSSSAGQGGHHTACDGYGMPLSFRPIAMLSSSAFLQPSSNTHDTASSSVAVASSSGLRRNPPPPPPTFSEGESLGPLLASVRNNKALAPSTVTNDAAAPLSAGALLQGIARKQQQQQSSAEKDGEEEEPRRVGGGGTLALNLAMPPPALPIVHVRRGQLQEGGGRSSDGFEMPLAPYSKNVNNKKIEDTQEKSNNATTAGSNETTTDKLLESHAVLPLSKGTVRARPFGGVSDSSAAGPPPPLTPFKQSLLRAFGGAVQCPPLSHLPLRRRSSSSSSSAAAADLLHGSNTNSFSSLAVERLMPSILFEVSKPIACGSARGRGVDAENTQPDGQTRAAGGVVTGSGNGNSSTPPRCCTLSERVLLARELVFGAADYSYSGSDVRTGTAARRCGGLAADLIVYPFATLL